MASHVQDQVYQHSLRDPESFWLHHAHQLTWAKPPSRALLQKSKHLPNGTIHPHWSWFPDGQISTSFNCVDRHVRAGNGDKKAIIWDSPVSASKQTLTYGQLLDEVEVLAGVLRETGVRKGDVVIVYSGSRPRAGLLSTAFTDRSSAHDTPSSRCSACYLAARRYPRSCFWGFFCGIFGSEDRGIISSSHHDRLMWYRRW